MKWFLVDVDNLAYRAHHAFRSLSHNGQNTAVAYGFLKMLTQISYDLGKGRFLFAFDSRPSLRSKMYPGYKANRKTGDQEERRIVRSQIDLLRKEILPAMGWDNNILHEKGYEADDLIASVCKHTKEEDCVIISNDKDYYQLLSEGSNRTTIYQSHNRLSYTLDDFRNEYDIIPAEWIDVLVLVGCSTDGIKGIDGVGIKSAIKWLNEELDFKSSYYKKIMASKDEVYRVNMDLVRLPLAGTPIYNPKNASEGSPEQWDKVVKEYGMDSLVGLYPDGSSPTSFKTKGKKNGKK